MLKMEISDYPNDSQINRLTDLTGSQIHGFTLIIKGVMHGD